MRASRSAEPDRKRRLAACEAGVAAVEFALVFGALIMLLFGVFHVGRALMARNDMNHALGEVIRAVHLDPDTTPDALTAALQERLAGYDEVALEVAITEVVGTSFMEVSVQFPYVLAVPFLPAREIELRVETLAPLVSPLQG
jgi:Flp pilus assembly protein TadG